MIGRRLGRSLGAGLVVAAALVAPSVGGDAAGSAPRDGLLLVSDYDTGQVYSLRPDGSGLTQLSHATGEAVAGDATWSPDGRTIAYIVFENGIRSTLWTMNADGGGVRQVVAEGDDYIDRAPAYTPDGSHILFSRCRSDYEQCAISSVRPDGTGLRTVTAFTADNVDFDAATARDGRLAFARYNAGGVISQIWVARADGSRQRAITPPRLEALGPAFSPDGRVIDFSSNSSRLGGDNYTITPSGRHLRRLTRTAYPLFSGFGVYSPSGARIAFTTNRRYPDRSAQDLFVMRADGSHETQVRFALNHVSRVSWAPAVAASVTRRAETAIATAPRRAAEVVHDRLLRMQPATRPVTAPPARYVRR